MGSLGFMIAVGVCAISLASAGVFWMIAHRKSSDWTAPGKGRFEVWARIFLAMAVFAGLCAFALYGWTY